jgi:hypothetical protein
MNVPMKSQLTGTQIGAPELAPVDRAVFAERFLYSSTTKTDNQYPNGCGW